MKLIANLCIFNESSKGNLRRCLDNLRQYCDILVIYDDASEDNSVEIADNYTEHIIRGEHNDQMNELAHKQALLERSIALGATHVFWLDGDEVLDRAGTEGGLRRLCEEWPDGLDAYSFPEVNLWRSQTWARTDTLFARARFVRLWKVTPDIHFDVRTGVHLRLYPATIERVTEAPFRVLHYGFWDYVRMMEKIGAHRMDLKELKICAEKNWILDERECSCYRVHADWYPPGTEPVGEWPEPLPIPPDELETAEELWRRERLIDADCSRQWEAKHRAGYHGSDAELRLCNLLAWCEGGADKMERRSLFRFDPTGVTVIDIGAGGGWFALDCLRAGARKVICLEADAGLIEQAQKSFEQLGIFRECYEWIQVRQDESLRAPMADFIYVVAFFQHLPWQLCRTWFRWVARHLKSGGEAHFQFHRSSEDRNTFADGEQTVSTAMLERDLADAGMSLKSKRMMVGPGVLPVWWAYKLEFNNETAG